MNDKGYLYLIPTTLGESNPFDVLPITVKNTIDQLDYFIVENEKTARRFIKSIHPEKKQSDLNLFLLNKRTESSAHNTFIEPCLHGKSVGIISEAGCPGVADPGAEIVALAHQNDIKVIPLVGPSSILMAIMSSGMNGQSFAFNGYLPIDKSDKKKAVKNFERLSHDYNQSQLFIETPYRNNKLVEDLLQTLHKDTLLCIATDISLKTEYIKTKTVSQWKFEKPDLHKRPTIFIIHKS